MKTYRGTRSESGCLVVCEERGGTAAPGAWPCAPTEGLAALGDTVERMRWGEGRWSQGGAAPFAACVTVLVATGRHSRDFEWGYGGSGPAELALSMLTDLVGAEGADRRYQAFKWAVIARLPHAGWEMTEAEVRGWLEEGRLPRCVAGEAGARATGGDVIPPLRSAAVGMTGQAEADDAA